MNTALHSWPDHTGSGLPAAPLLAVRGLVKHFPVGRRERLVAINDISFEIGRGEALGLVGESGSGKTTTGRCIMQLIEPTAGHILFNGKEIAAGASYEARQWRSRIQMVFQEPFESLNPRMRVETIVAEPLKLTTSLTLRQRRERVVDVMDLVQLGPSYLAKYAHQLSTGVQQRIGIARALATQPDLIVLDEPTSALDVSVRAGVLDLLCDLQERLGISYLFISHDLTAIRRVCNRTAIMYLGKIVESAETEQIFEKPLHPYSRALLSSVLYPDPTIQLSRFVLEGEIPSPINLPTGCHLHRRCPWATDVCQQAYPPLEQLSEGRFVSCFKAELHDNG